jgi:hypothetical protein
MKLGKPTNELIRDTVVLAVEKLITTKIFILIRESVYDPIRILVSIEFIALIEEDYQRNPYENR